MHFPHDNLVFTPDQVDLSRSPLAGQIDAETFVLGAFNPGLTRLPNGNMLMMVRIAEALRHPIEGDHIRSIRWSEVGYNLDRWPLSSVETSDPRVFTIRNQPWNVLGLTSLSWLLPVELTPDGREIVAVHYDRAVAPRAPYQCYGIEDPRISQVGDRWLMTVCSVSPERQGTSLYSSPNALDWTLEGLVLDHQNKDMLIFQGLIDGAYWAQTRPLGDAYFAYHPSSEWRAGPSINLARSPDALHWKPCDHPGIRPHAATLSTARTGGGAPPVLTDRGWLALWHGVEPGGTVGIYRTYWSMLHRDEPWRVVATDHEPLLVPDATLTTPIADKMYLSDVVFTTGIADGGDHFIVASGEADLACRITHVPKSVFA